MAGDASFMASPDVIDAVPGFRSIVLPAQATERSELEGQGPGLLTDILCTLSTHLVGGS